MVEPSRIELTIKYPINTMGSPRIYGKDMFTQIAASITNTRSIGIKIERKVSIITIATREIEIIVISLESFSTIFFISNALAASPRI